MAGQLAINEQYRYVNGQLAITFRLTNEERRKLDKILNTRLTRERAPRALCVESKSIFPSESAESPLVTLFHKHYDEYWLVVCDYDRNLSWAYDAAIRSLLAMQLSLANHRRMISELARAFVQYVHACGSEKYYQLVCEGIQLLLWITVEYHLLRYEVIDMITDEIEVLPTDVVQLICDFASPTTTKEDFGQISAHDIDEAAGECLWDAIVDMKLSREDYNALAEKMRNVFEGCNVQF